MNGRMYDPRLARFLSPDPFVQAPDFTQSFNRFSYAWNNPLKYTDPSGEIIFTILAAIFASPLLPVALVSDFGGLMNMATNVSNIDNGWDALAYFGIGAAAGAAGSVAGLGITSALAGGTFWAGVAGVSQSVATGFFSGFVSGASGGFSSGFILGFGNTAMNSDYNDIGDLFREGLEKGFKGAIMGGIAGGVASGVDALQNDRSFWTGAEKQHGIVKINLDGSSTFTAESDLIVDSTKDMYTTNLNNNSAVSVDINGEVRIEIPGTINKITAIKAPINTSMGNVFLGRRVVSFTNTWSNPPTQLTLHGYRYRSNPILSIKDLFSFRKR